MPNYYDIDAILAEEELVTVRPSFTFAHLAHLDPECYQQFDNAGRKRRRDEADELGGNTQGQKLGRNNTSLPEGTKIKMPLWAADRWITLGFVKVPSLPKHFGPKMREKLEADPVSMDLRSKSDHYFLTGMLLSSLLERAAHVAQEHQRQRRNRRSRNSLQAHTDFMSLEAQNMRLALLNTFLGPRLCRNFDWTLSSLDALEDDVTHHVSKLSTLERIMFEKGVEASGAVSGWRDTRGKLGVSTSILRAKRRVPVQAKSTGWVENNANVVTPIGEN